MRNTLRQFEGSATNSGQNEFKVAVFKLTAFYAVGVFLILFVSNIVVYQLFARSFNTNLDDDYVVVERVEEGRHEIEIDEVKANLMGVLLSSDIILMILTVAIAYFLAKKTLTPLEEAYEKQRRFVADAAHELRTPLTVMKAGSEVILSKDREKEEYIKFTRESLQEVERLTKLSNDLLFLVSNENIKDRQVESINLSELCKKQVEAIRPYAGTKNIVVNQAIEEEVVLNGEKDKLSRLLVNLLKNAIDYNKTNGSVSVTLDKKGHSAVLSVQDTGIGISETHLPHIFERFYKADNSRTQWSSTGTGLGLAIVKEIADEHHGSIKVKSTLGQGSTFEVILPLA